MKKTTDNFDRADIDTDDRCDNDLPGASGSDALPHINQFFNHLNGREDVPTAYDPIVPTGYGPEKPGEMRSDPQGGQPGPEERGISDAAYDSVAAAKQKKNREKAKKDRPGSRLDPKQKRKIISVAVALVVLASILGVGLYIGLPRLSDSADRRHSDTGQAPVNGEGHETGTVSPAVTAPSETATEKTKETTTAKPEEPTTDPDLKYTPGTYYVNAIGGSPLYLGTSTFSVVQWLVPEGTKVEVTEVQVGSSFDGAKLNFGKIQYRSQTGWIKMDSTAEKQSGKSSGIDYDAVLRCNAEYWKNYNDADVLAAYAGEIKRLTDEYGAGRIGTTKIMSEDLCGLNIVRLIDLDQDGQPELYCAYCREGEAAYERKQAVYRYAGHGETERLYEGDYTIKSSDYSPFVMFRENNGIVYFAAGAGQDRFYYELKKGGFVGTEIMESYADNVAIRIDGKEVTAEEYKRIIDKYEGGACYTISLFGYSEFFEDNNLYVDDILSETAAVVSMLAPYEPVVAEETRSSIDEPTDPDTVPHDRPWEEDPYQWEDDFGAEDWW